MSRDPSEVAGLGAADVPDAAGGSGATGGSGTTGGPARRGRPRSEKAHQAIMQAAADLLLERGLAAVSMDAVAERARVSKATIYRWWPTKETLALDVLYHEWSDVPEPQDTGTLRGDLLSMLLPWARLATRKPYGRVMSALLTQALTEPAFAAEYHTRFIGPRREQARVVFDRAIARGEISPDTDIEVALDLIYGPVYHRLLHGHAPLNDRFVREVIDLAMRGIAPASGAGTRSGTGAASAPDTAAGPAPG